MITYKPLPLRRLSCREVELLTWVAGGWRVAQIARHLGLAVDTCDNTLRHAYCKLRVQDKTSAVLVAMQLAYFTCWDVPMSPAREPTSAQSARWGQRRH